MTKWKFVFWITAILFAFEAWKTPSAKSLVAWAPLLLLFLSLFPLYGYAYQVVIGSKALSTGVFLVNLVIYLVTWGFLVIEGMQTLNLFDLFGLVLWVAITYLFLYPQYAYAFKSSHIWQVNDT
jgi:hypothetical protein